MRRAPKGRHCIAWGVSPRKTATQSQAPEGRHWFAESPMPPPGRRSFASAGNTFKYRNSTNAYAQSRASSVRPETRGAFGFRQSSRTPNDSTRPWSNHTSKRSPSVVQFRWRLFQFGLDDKGPFAAQHFRLGASVPEHVELQGAEDSVYDPLRHNRILICPGQRGGPQSPILSSLPSTTSTRTPCSSSYSDRQLRITQGGRCGSGQGTTTRRSRSFVQYLIRARRSGNSPGQNDGGVSARKLDWRER